MRPYSQRRKIGYALSVLWLLSSLFLPGLSAEEECLYDQTHQKNNYVELEKQHPNSRYIEEKNKIVIPIEKGEVHLRVGGCVHYGVSIQLRMTDPGITWDREKIFLTVAELLGEYGQGMADPGEFKQVTEKGRWTDISDGDGKYYFIGYPKFTSFEVYQRIEGDDLVVGISFYN